MTDQNDLTVLEYVTAELIVWLSAKEHRTSDFNASQALAAALQSCRLEPLARGVQYHIDRMAAASTNRALDPNWRDPIADDCEHVIDARCKQTERIRMKLFGPPQGVLKTVIARDAEGRVLEVVETPIGG